MADTVDGRNSIQRKVRVSPVALISSCLAQGVTSSQAKPAAFEGCKTAPAHSHGRSPQVSAAVRYSASARPYRRARGERGVAYAMMSPRLLVAFGFGRRCPRLAVVVNDRVGIVQRPSASARALASKL